MESEISQSQETNVLWFYLRKVPRVAKLRETESRTVVTRGWEEGAMGSYDLTSVDFSIWRDGRVPETDGDDGCLTMWTYFMPLNRALRMVKMVNFLFRIFHHNFRKAERRNTLYFTQHRKEVREELERQIGDHCSESSMKTVVAQGNKDAENLWIWNIYWRTKATGLTIDGWYHCSP